MPWSTQQCSKWNWPVQHRSLLCCLERPRQQRLLSWLVLDDGIADFSSTLWVSGRERAQCTEWWRCSSRSVWTIKVQLCMFHWVISFGWPSRQVAQLYAGSLACRHFLWLWARCRPVSDGTARSTVCATRNWWQAWRATRLLQSLTDCRSLTRNL